jgi:hypothetical protein
MTEPPSNRTTVKRKPQRATYDRATIDKILDEGLICHTRHITRIGDGRRECHDARSGDRCRYPAVPVRVGDGADRCD